jgi:hypothetical protein
MYIVIIHKQFTKPRFPMITMLILAISNGMTITKPPTFPTTLDILNLNRHLEGNESMWCPIISNSWAKYWGLWLFVMGIPIRYICSWMGECQLLPAVGGSCLDKVFLRTCHFDDFSFQFNRVFLPTCPNEQLKKRDCTNKHNLYKYLWNTFRAKTKKPGWWFQPL